MTEPAPAALLIRRTPAAEAHDLRVAKLGAVAAATGFGIAAIGFGIADAIAVASGAGFASVGWDLALVGGLAPSALVGIQNVRVQRRLAGLELSITEHGVAYRCAAGVFPAPWPAVRRMAVYGRSTRWGRPGPGADFLLVQARDWRGPVARLAYRTATLRIPLDNLNLAPREIARTVHRLSHGRATVTGPAFKRR